MTHDATIVTRSLGAGRVVSAIGFGTWAIGGPHSRNGQPIGWGEVDDDESIRAIRAAVDAGVTLFDTADVYGCGHSERMLARALPRDRGEILLATKFGYTYDEATKESPGSDASPAYIRRACEASLRRLRVEAIDLYQFHLGDHPLDQARDVLATLEDLTREGKIRSFGWSTDDPERAALFASNPHCAAIQLSFNIFDGNAATLQVAERFGVAALVRSPLGMGLLTGRITASTRFAADDVRSGWDLAGEVSERLAVLERIRSVLTEDGRTLAQGALGWLLARSANIVPIPGVRTEAQAEDNAGVLRRGPLTREQMVRIDRVLAEAAH